MTFRKGYIEELKFKDLINRYEECSRMLKSLEKSLISWKIKNNTK
ncbi:hypothetical protein [Candidatus Kuenenia stuttgartiensis]